MGTMVIDVGLPRVVDGVEMPGRASRGKVGILDRVPLAIRAPDPEDAPLVLRQPHHDPRFPAGEWREFGGDLFVSMRPPPPPSSSRSRRPIPPYGPGSLADLVRADIEMAVRGRGPGAHHEIQHLADWEQALRALPSRHVPMLPPERVRVTGDDGMADRLALAARIEGNVIVVGGVLHHRAPPPFILVHRNGRDARIQNSLPGTLPVRGDTPAMPWNGFPPHAAGDADAFAMLLAGEDGGRVLRAGLDDVEVVDAVALARAYDDGPDAVLRRCVAAYVHEVRGHVGKLRDDGVMAWLRLRAGGVDLGEACRDIGILSAACTAARGEPSVHFSEIGRLGGMGREILCRLSASRGRDLTLDDGDEAALGGLAP